jgi:hypothetical protein
MSRSYVQAFGGLLGINAGLDICRTPRRLGKILGI